MEDHKAVETSIQSPQKRHKDSADTEKIKKENECPKFIFNYSILEKKI